MAVYAGRTRAEANAMLARVKATGKFDGANLRRMSIGFNGNLSAVAHAFAHRAGGGLK
jgi:hypothetical protein